MRLLQKDWSAYKKMFSLAVPVMMSFLALHLLGITDVIMVGRLGAEAIAAVGLANTIIYFVLAPIEGFLAAALILFPGLAAKKSHSEMKTALFTLSLLSVVLGVVLMMFYPLMAWYIGTISNDVTVVRLAREYLLIRLLGGIFLTSSIVWGRFLLSLEKNFQIALISYIVVFANIVMNWMLIFGPGPFPAWGTAGAAWASLAAQALNVALLAICGIKAMKGWTGRRSFSWDFLKRFSKIGWPMGLTYLIEILAWTTFVSMIAKLGTIALASHEIALRIKDLSFLLGIAIANVVTQQVSFFIGKEDAKAAEVAVKTGVRINVVIMGVIGLLYWFFPKFFVGLVSHDPILIEQSTKLLRFMALYQIADAVFITYRASMEGLGKTATVRNVFFIASYLVWLPLSWLAVYVLKWDVVGAWLGLMIAVFLLAVIFSRLFRKEVWRAKPLDHPPVTTINKEMQ